MIQFIGVSKEYPRSGLALDNVSFRLRKGEFAFLTGHSGAGKTTVLRLVHFQERPSRGEVKVTRFSSTDVKRRQVPEARRRVGFVFQDFRLLPRLTASENVAFALEVIGTPKAKIGPRVQRLLSQVGLAAKARSLPSELSGGERQRVVIARALATDPLILLADEPTGNLDPRAAESVFELFQRINHTGMAVLMATHDLELIKRHPEVRLLEMDHGKLVYDSGHDVASDSAVARPDRGARPTSSVERDDDAPRADTSGGAPPTTGSSAAPPPADVPAAAPDVASGPRPS